MWAAKMAQRGYQVTDLTLMFVIPRDQSRSGRTPCTSPHPWLRQLRCRFPSFVRRLPSYYGGVRLLMIAHHRLRLLAFPMRTRAGRVTYLFANHEISRFPFKQRPHMPRSATTPGRPGTRVSVPFRVAFHSVKNVGARDEVIFAVQ